jgi:hypothetical protein
MERSDMKQHRKNNQNPNKQEGTHPFISQENNFHFPENEIPNFKLANEVGLSLNNQSIHQQVNIASLLNRYPIQAFLFSQAKAASDEKFKQSLVTNGLTSKECFEFLTNKPLEEKAKDVPDVIWATRLGNIPITSQQEMTKTGFNPSERSIFKVKAERHEK